MCNWASLTGFRESQIDFPTQTKSGFIEVNQILRLMALCILDNFLCLFCIEVIEAHVLLSRHV